MELIKIWQTGNQSKSTIPRRKKWDKGNHADRPCSSILGYQKGALVQN
jgi:hypothetical protein